METNKHFESALPFLETRPCAERIQSNLVPPNWLCRDTDGRKMHKCCCLSNSYSCFVSSLDKSTFSPQGFYSSIMENQWSGYGIPGGWWESTLSSLVVHPSVILRQQESCGVCVGSTFSPIEYIRVETLSHHVHWTVFFNFTCIFKSCYISGCQGDRLTCFLINTIRLFRRKSFHIMQWSS